MDKRVSIGHTRKRGWKGEHGRIVKNLVYFGDEAGFNVYAKGDQPQEHVKGEERVVTCLGLHFQMILGHREWLTGARPRTERLFKIHSNAVWLSAELGCAELPPHYAHPSENTQGLKQSPVVQRGNGTLFPLQQATLPRAPPAAIKMALELSGSSYSLDCSRP